MKEDFRDIGDNEIRIISGCKSDANKPDAKRNKGKGKSYKKVFVILACILTLALATAVVLFMTHGEKQPGDNHEAYGESLTPSGLGHAATAASSTTSSGKYTEVIDTLSGDVPLRLFIPRNARPSLSIGNAMVNDTTVVLMAQAADIRGDNGDIAGAFVMEGELISRGQSRPGFCSIIGDKITIGTAEAAPQFEQTISEGGYFFRQYPLVTGGNVAGNKQVRKSIRKALVIIKGTAMIAVSREKTSQKEFAIALRDLGASDALSLTGSDASYMEYRDGQGRKHSFSSPWGSDRARINYIIWN